MHQPRRIVLDHRCAAGDTLVATAAVRALHESQPGMFETDFIGHHGRTAPDGNNLFANNPYIMPLDPHSSQHVTMDYGYAIQQCGARPYHFLHGFVENLAHQLGVHIELKQFKGDLYLSAEEREPWPGLPERYAIVDAGYKGDFTAKMWSHHRYQEVVNATKDRITWVQIGSVSDTHKPLDNVVSLLGRTNLRQLIRIFYRSSLVLTPVSLPMHLAAAVPTIADGPKTPHVSLEDRHRRWQMDRSARLKQGSPAPPLPGESSKIRPCIVLMGQREQRSWEAYNGHTLLGTEGKLACGVGVGEGCWRNKTVRIDGDRSLCMQPLQDEAGEFVPECLHRVSVADVVRAVESYL